MKTTVLFLSLPLFLTAPLLSADDKAPLPVSTGDSAKTKAPPPWAPAVGQRAKYTYRYFPAHEVYQRTGDKVWFYQDNGSWSSDTRLPFKLKADTAASVSLEMDADAPYIFHGDVKLAHPKPNPAGPKNERLASAESAKSADRDKAAGTARSKKAEPGR